MQPLPHAGSLPVAQAAPAGDGAAAAEFLRQQAPWAAGAQDENDAAECGAVGNAGAASLGLGRLFRKQRFDGFPKVIGDEGLFVHGGKDAMPARF